MVFMGRGRMDEYRLHRVAWPWAHRNVIAVHWYGLPYPPFLTRNKASFFHTPFTPTETALCSLYRQ